MYKILITDTAKRDIKKLDFEVQKRIVEKLKDYSSDPIHFSRKLQDSSIGTYRFRIGDYRISFDIVEKDLVILRIRHRKDIYR